MLSRAGINPDPSLVDNEIKKPAFRLRQGHRAVQRAAIRRQFLARQGLTPRDAEAELTDQLTQRHFIRRGAERFQDTRTHSRR